MPRSRRRRGCIPEGHRQVRTEILVAPLADYDFSVHSNAQPRDSVIKQQAEYLARMEQRRLRDQRRQQKQQQQQQQHQQDATPQAVMPARASFTKPILGGLAAPVSSIPAAVMATPVTAAAAAAAPAAPAVVTLGGRPVGAAPVTAITAPQPVFGGVQPRLALAARTAPAAVTVAATNENAMPVAVPMSASKPSVPFAIFSCATFYIQLAVTRNCVMTLVVVCTA